MVTWQEVQSVLNSLPPIETRSANDLREEERIRRINAAIAVVMDWLTIRNNPALDINQLLAQSADSTHDLADEILENLLNWIRVIEGQANQFNCIQTLIHNNQLVRHHPQKIEFYNRLSKIPNGIINSQELNYILRGMNSHDCVALVNEHFTPNFLGRLFFESTISSHAAFNVINTLVTTSNCNQMQNLILNRLHEHLPLSYEVAQAQYELISDRLEPQQHPIMKKFISVHYNLELLYEKPDSYIDSLNPNTPAAKITKALILANQLLLSRPGETRQQLLAEYQTMATSMVGHANPKWQAAGFAMMALGAAVVALGFTAIISGGVLPIIPLGLAAVVVGLSIFSHNRQKGPSRTMQRLHDEMKRQPDVSFSLPANAY